MYDISTLRDSVRPSEIVGEIGNDERKAIAGIHATHLEVIPHLGLPLEGKNCRAHPISTLQA